MLEHLPELKAELFSLIMEAVGLPHLTEGDRDAVLTRWFGEDALKPPPATPAQLAFIGIGFQLAPPAQTVDAAAGEKDDR